MDVNEESASAYSAEYVPPASQPGPYRRRYACWASATILAICAVCLLESSARHIGLSAAKVAPFLGFANSSAYAIVAAGVLMSCLMPGESVWGSSRRLIQQMTSLGAAALGWLTLGSDSSLALTPVLLGSNISEAAVSGSLAIGLAGSSASLSAVASGRRWAAFPALLVLAIAYGLAVIYLYGDQPANVLCISVMLILVSTSMLTLHSAKRGLAALGQQETLFTKLRLPAIVALLLFPLLLRLSGLLDATQPMALRCVFAAVLSISLAAAVSTLVNLLIGGITFVDQQRERALQQELMARAQARLIAAEQGRVAAEEANRRKAQFFARMSHELRTPLTSMLGFAQLMALDANDPLTITQRAQLMHVERAGQHLQLLTDDLLDLSSIDAGEVKLRLGVVPLAPVLDKVISMLKPMAVRANVTLAVRGVDANMHVWADELRLVQALMNLLSNALKYNRSGGAAWVTVEKAEVRGTETNVVVPAVNITVHDNGPGISATQLPHLFEPFNRLGQEDTVIEGSGLGLVLSRALVRLMHGDIKATSKTGEGSQFTVSLPLAGSECASRTASARA